MNEINSLAATLFLREFSNDPEAFLTPEQEFSFRDESATLLFCVPDLCDRLESIPVDSNEVEIQKVFYDVGKENFGEENLRRFFALLYLIIWHNTSGPRFGVFAKLFGLENFIGLIRTNFDAARNELVF